MRDLSNRSVYRALVAGLSLTLNHHKNASSAAVKMLSPTGYCYTFDHGANGYYRSDAVAGIFIERGSYVYVTIAGTGTNSDGSKNQRSHVP